MRKQGGQDEKTRWRRNLGGGPDSGGLWSGRSQTAMGRGWWSERKAPVGHNNGGSSGGSQKKMAAADRERKWKSALLETLGKSGCGQGGGEWRWDGDSDLRGRIRSATVATTVVAVGKRSGGRETKSYTSGTPGKSGHCLGGGDGDGSGIVVREEGFGGHSGGGGCQNKWATGRGRVAFWEFQGSQAVDREEEDNDGSGTVVREEGYDRPQRRRWRQAEEVVAGRGRVTLQECRGSQAAVQEEEDGDGLGTVVGEEGSVRP